MKLYYSQKVFITVTVENSDLKKKLFLRLHFSLLLFSNLGLKGTTFQLAV